ncbi:hypothetical protein K2X85_15530 [bacterium]|nr:hypothetical protein [bacterium]
MDPQMGARSYMISIAPTVVALLMTLLPSIPVAIFVGHLLTLALASLGLVVFWRMSQPIIGELLAALATLAVLTTALFSAQIDQLGMEIPLATCTILAVSASTQNAWGRAITYSLFAFAVKSTGILVSASITGYLILLGIMLFSEGRRSEAAALLRFIAMGVAIVAAEAALVAWGDTTISMRLAIPWPRSLSLDQGVLWCPDFGILLLLSAIGSMVHLKHFLIAKREGDGKGSKWLRAHASPLICMLIVAGLTIAMRRYIFIPRYATLAVPLFYLIILSAWSLQNKSFNYIVISPIMASAALVAVVSFQCWNSNGRYFPSISDIVDREHPVLTMFHSRMCAYTERSREYLADHLSALSAMKRLEIAHAESLILADIPYNWYLTKPRLGYVTKALPRVISARDLSRTIEEFSKAVLSVSQPRPIFVFAPRTRAIFPSPGSFANVIYRDELTPPLVVYEVIRERIPKTRIDLEEWYLKKTWENNFVGQRSLSRSPFLIRTGRALQSSNEIEIGLQQTATDSFLYPFLVERKNELARQIAGQGTPWNGGGP